MEIMLLSKLDNLLSRIDEKNKVVFLKKDQELEKITFQNLFKNSNSFSQLSLRSKSEVVCLDLHRVLQLSPFLAKLVAELRHCCFSPHDQVDICLDQFSPHLLNIIKNLLEHGECTVKSSLEGKQLEALIQAMGMDSSMQLYRRIHVEKSTTVEDSKKKELETNIHVAFLGHRLRPQDCHVEADNDISKVLDKNVNIENENVSDSPLYATNSRKRKLSGEKNKLKLGFKLRQCKECKQSYNASQNHICVNTSDKEILDTNGEFDQDDESEMRLEASRDDQECKSGIENNAEDEMKSESNQKSCPQCHKVYKMIGAGPKAFIKHIQACKDGAGPKAHVEQIQSCEDGALFEAEKDDESTNTFKLSVMSVKQQHINGDESKDMPCPRCGKLYKRSGPGKVYFERHKQNCFKRNYGEESETDKIHAEKIHADIEKPKETKNLMKGRGVTHDKYITKLPATVTGNQGGNFPDLDAPQKVACPVKERKECPSCGKLYVAEGRGAMYDVHVAKCKGENLDGGVYDISLFADTDEKNETGSKQTYECFECRKIFNVKHHFQKHIQFCQVELSNSFLGSRQAPTQDWSNYGQEDKSKDSKLDRKSLDFMQCEKCERIFVGSEAFTKHQASCSEVKEKHPCPYGCGKEFIYKGRLKNHYKFCPMMKMNTTQNLNCKICGEGEFNENDLYLHLYKRHEELRKKIHKSVSVNIANYYSLEAKKLNCVCPICDEEMKASRHKVGIHWAVVHKKIKSFYNLCLKVGNGVEKNGEKESKCENNDKASKCEDVEKVENIEDYEEIVMDEQELKDGRSIQETDHIGLMNNVDNEKSVKEEKDEKLQEGNPILHNEEESTAKICITNVRAIGTKSSLKQPSRPSESELKRKEVISKKAPSTTKHENRDKDMDGDGRVHSNKGVGRDVKDTRVIRNQLFSESDSEDGSN